MSASYGVQITLPLPVSGQVQWDGPLNDLLQAVLDVLGQRVTVDGLDITSTLDLQGNALINATNVRFVPDSDPGIANTVFYTNGDLFARDGVNRLVQVTSGGVINVAGTGGFGGDYVLSNQNGATFNNPTSTFTFTAAGGTQYATIEGGEVKVHNGSAAQSVGLRSPSSLSTYEMTFPGGLPAGQQALVVCDATGGLNFRLSASFTQCLDVIAALSTDGATTTWNPGRVISGGSADFIWPFTFGDRIDAIAYSVAGTPGPVTASLMEYTDGVGVGTGGSMRLLARATFNNQVGNTLQSGTPTMTGTFPQLPAGTGSFVIRIGTTSNVTISSLRVIGQRKIIS